MVNYKLTLDPWTKEPNGVIRFPDVAGIPFDPANTDYQDFLAWKAEGNEPLPADDNGQAAE
jgi:hypothetical protein